ncbi:MAG TPA: hypothetical protein VEG30_10960 [Terriglobales bacterium]|nr:hypothetical protein [Terriglobales bacterium]
MLKYGSRGFKGPRYFLLVIVVLILPALAESYWAWHLLWPQSLITTNPTKPQLAARIAAASPESSSNIPDAGYSWNGASGEPGPAVYPYSVVPGGVRSAESLKRAIAADTLVAQHYSDFHVGQARMIQLRTDLQAYVSFRLKDGVYWTRRPVLLKRGESVLTDGVNLARTRCANRVSLAPRMPHAPHEPPPQALDTAGLPSSEFPEFPDPPLPVFIPEFGRTLPTLPLPPVGPPGSGAATPFVPFFVPPGGGGGGEGKKPDVTPPVAPLPIAPVPGSVNPTGPSPEPTAPVPEPGTITLLVTGSAIVGWWERRRVTKSRTRSE